MLVPLPALLTAELWTVALPAFLGQGLAVARPPDACLLESAVSFVRGPVVLVVVDSALLHLVVDPPVGAHDKVVVVGG
jgi:hypothetical protein